MSDKKKSKSAFDAPRGDLFYLLPEQVVVVRDKTHALYDPRVEQPVTKEFVADIEERGVVQPIRVVKDDGVAYVVMGRRRAEAVRLINEKRRKEGAGDEMMIRLPTVVMKGNENDLLAAAIAENVHRRADRPSELAAKAAKLLNMCGDLAKVGVCLAMSHMQVRRLIKLGEMCNEIQRAVDARQIGMEAALQLADLTKDEQKAAFKKLLEAAGDVEEPELPSAAPRRMPKVPAKAVSKIPGAKPAKFELRSRREIEDRLETKNLATDYRLALLWVLHRELEVPPAGIVNETKAVERTVIGK